MRSPTEMRLLHFLALGALMLAARTWVVPLLPVSGWASAPVIEIGGAQRALIREQVRLDRADADGSARRELAKIDQAIDDEVLYRAALARGLDSESPVVRERVVQDMRVLAGESGATDEDALFREGLRLGLDRSDLVVRRQLAATMRLLTAAPARMEAVTDRELLDALETHADEFRMPATTTFTHVFVSARRGRTEAEARARELLGELTTGSVARGDAPFRGDAFALGFEMVERTDVSIAAAFGAGFATALSGADEQAWTGPIASSYGLHLVWVDHRAPTRLPDLDAVRGRLLERVYAERADRRVKEWLAAQRRRYEIRIEPPAARASTLESLPVAALALPRAAAVVGD